MFTLRWGNCADISPQDKPLATPSQITASSNCENRLRGLANVSGTCIDIFLGGLSISFTAKNVQCWYAVNKKAGFLCIQQRTDGFSLSLSIFPRLLDTYFSFLINLRKCFVVYWVGLNWAGLKGVGGWSRNSSTTGGGRNCRVPSQTEVRWRLEKEKMRTFVPIYLNYSFNKERKKGSKWSRRDIYNINNTHKISIWKQGVGDPFAIKYHSFNLTPKRTFVDQIESTTELQLVNP